MKNRRVSLAVKMNILIIAIILAVSVLLMVISNVAYRQGVFAPYQKSLEEAEVPSGEIGPYINYFLGFLGTEELQQVRGQVGKDDQAMINWMTKQPPMENSMIDDQPQPNLLINVYIVSGMVDRIKGDLDADEVCLEAVKDGTVYRICSSSKNGEYDIFLTEFGKEKSYYDQPAEKYAHPADHVSGGKYETIRCASFPVDRGEYRIWMIYDLTAVTREYHHFLNVSIFAVLFLTVVVSVISLLLLRRYLIRPVRSLAQAATEFTPEGDGTYSPDKISRADVRTADEIGDLSREIRSMQERIVENTGNLARMTAERERISTELDLARKIQAYMLPETFPAFPDRKEFDLFAMMTPAREVGGDFYDFFLIDEDHLAVVIADVSGKGIPAAMFMMVAMSLIKNQMLSGNDPAQTLEHVNRLMCERNRSNTFVTVWIAVVELSTGKGVVCNAGHEKPCIRRAGGDFEMVSYKHDLIVGGIPDVSYHLREFEMHPGDCLFVYTDGVPEASNSRNELFGTEKLISTLNRNPDAAPEELIRGVLDAVNRFADGAPQFDDITMLSLKYFGKQ